MLLSLDFTCKLSQPTFRKVRVLKEQTIGIDVMETGRDMGPGMCLIHWTMQRCAILGQVHCYHTVTPPSLPLFPGHQADLPGPLFRPLANLL